MSARKLIELAAANHGVTPAQIVGPSRHKTIVRARHAAMLAIRTRSEGEGNAMSYPEIGELFGHRDHTTVMHGCDQAFARMPARGAA